MFSIRQLARHQNQCLHDQLYIRSCIEKSVFLSFSLTDVSACWATRWNIFLIVFYKHLASLKNDCWISNQFSRIWNTVFLNCMKWSFGRDYFFSDRMKSVVDLILIAIEDGAEVVFWNNWCNNVDWCNKRHQADNSRSDANVICWKWWWMTANHWSGQSVRSTIYNKHTGMQKRLDMQWSTYYVWIYRFKIFHLNRVANDAIFWSKIENIHLSICFDVSKWPWLIEKKWRFI